MNLHEPRCTEIGNSLPWPASSVLSDPVTIPCGNHQQLRAATGQSMFTMTSALKANWRLWSPVWTLTVKLTWSFITESQTWKDMSWSQKSGCVRGMRDLWSCSATLTRYVCVRCALGQITRYIILFHLSRNMTEKRAELQQMIQEIRPKIEQIKRSVKLSKKTSDSVQVFSALIQRVKKSLPQLTDMIEQKQKTMEKEAEGFMRFNLWADEEKHWAGTALTLPKTTSSYSKTSHPWTLFHPQRIGKKSKSTPRVREAGESCGSAGEDTQSRDYLSHPVCWWEKSESWQC